MYTTWKEIVDNKDKFVGGVIIEKGELGEVPTIIQDITLEGDVFTIEGKHWSMMTVLKYGIIHPSINNTKITSKVMKENEWTLYEKGKYPGGIEEVENFYKENENEPVFDE
jgi:hypothetical protein